MSNTWSPQAPEWSEEEKSLLPLEIAKESRTTLATVLEKSDNFVLKFPVDSNRCKTLRTNVDNDTLERNINSAYPVLHANILQFYAQFILHKRKNGNTIEKALYNDMNLLQFVDRLLSKRAATFIGKQDSYTLLNGKKGRGKWETIGTLAEKKPLVLKDCLSYEEVKLSAFLSVSSFTHFVNLGDRKNMAKYETDRSGIQDEGIIMGIIGPRLVKNEVMEYQELVITESQNTKTKGYGQTETPTIHHLFAKLYHEQCLECKEILEKKKTNPNRYTTLRNDELLDNVLYHKRLVFTMDTLFTEANQRALEKNTTAYIHVVGIGLGVWKKHPCQNKLFMDSCGQRILNLGKQLHNVSDICFAYIQHNACLSYKHGDVIPIEGHPLKGIRVHICKREPHAKLTGRDEGKLLVVSYAWDGNALPGNEFWIGKLGSSGDSAAASSTQITELHNPFINPNVSSGNLRVVKDGKVVGLEEYAAEVRRQKKRKLEN
ncbi:uncharacterized protein LOC664424 [Tribolium castaneum]|uniref:Uncharacterized protein n=1 Tax=Tribolium castaneum TaxID=7070 RepID=D6WR72_TRICA|nr:PREDICTED: uncharacterized protein LOC664424 [Tribolium castaneum]EFA06000.1 hypothetical protein TcasGA2_TC008826 [Tribolium castaneum]|eukprot:XP_975524.1 PREDICTED: uncharacterized protein LOC664424 [Tribolium castaneum]